MAKANIYETLLSNIKEPEENSSLNYMKNYIEDIKKTLKGLPNDYTGLSHWEIDETVATLELVIDKLFFLITDLKNY